MNKQEIIKKLYEIGAIKFGSFTLKSGIQSPIYIDLCHIVSSPFMIQAIADCIWNMIKDIQFDYICGVPYKALPITTAIALKYNKPMIIRRKESKNYGTRKAIEGCFSAGQTCIVIEDLFTSGISVLETVEPLEQAELKIEHIVGLIDRQQGGIINLQKRNYFVHAVFTLADIMQSLYQKGVINQEAVDAVNTYLRENQVRL